MTQNDFRQRLHELNIEAAQDLRLIEIFEVLTSSLHSFRLAYEMAMINEARKKDAESQQESK
jgi:hypothetical protein